FATEGAFSRASKGVLILSLMVAERQGSSQATRRGIVVSLVTPSRSCVYEDGGAGPTPQPCTSILSSRLASGSAIHQPEQEQSAQEHQPTKENQGIGQSHTRLTLRLHRGAPAGVASPACSRGSPDRPARL